MSSSQTIRKVDIAGHRAISSVCVLRKRIRGKRPPWPSPPKRQCTQWPSSTLAQSVSVEAPAAMDQPRSQEPSAGSSFPRQATLTYFWKAEPHQELHLGLEGLTQETAGGQAT